MMMNSTTDWIGLYLDDVLKLYDAVGMGSVAGFARRGAAVAWEQGYQSIWIFADRTRNCCEIRE